MTPAARRIAFRSQRMPNSNSRTPMTSWSACRGTRSRSGPSARTMSASEARPASAPSPAGLQPRTVAAESTIVSASTASTSELRNAAETAGATDVHAMVMMGGRKKCAATLASSDERETDRSITFLSFFFRRGLVGSALRRRPAAHEPEADREQRRAEEDADETEREHSAEHAEQHQHEGQARAAADQQGLHDIVDPAHDEEPPQRHEHGPAGLVLEEQPDRSADPYQRRSRRNDRKKGGDETQHQRAGHAGDEKADDRREALREPGADDADHHAVDGAADDLQQAAGNIAGDAVEAVAQGPRQRRAVAVEEKPDEGDQGELQHSLADDDAGLHQHCARRLRDPLQNFRERRLAAGYLAPSGVQRLAHQRDRSDPARGPGQSLGEHLAQPFDQLRDVVDVGSRDQREGQDQYQDHEQGHGERGERAPASEPALDQPVERPGRKAQDRGRQQRRKERLEHHQAADHQRGARDNLDDLLEAFVHFCFQAINACGSAPLRASMRPMRNTVSPAPDRVRTAASACSAATTTAMPMPQLNTRCISASATLPSRCSHSKTAGRGQEAFPMTALVSSGRMRGILPIRPPPVMWARPLTGSESRSLRTGLT